MFPASYPEDFEILGHVMVPSGKFIIVDTGPPRDGCHDRTP
ncbi:MAG: hypothetical protein ACFCD0_15110 [Gemmataceae bacterium]